MAMHVSEFKNYDILHCSRRKWISRLIMWFTGSRFCHTAIFVQVDGLPFIVDSQADGTNLRPYQEWIKKFNYAFLVTRDTSETAADKTQQRKRIFAIIGHTGYDYESLLIRQPLLILTGRWRTRGKKENERLYCSESVAYIKGWEDSERLSPQGVFERCLKHKNTIVGEREVK